METTQRHIREIFLLQLAIVCLVVVLCVLGVQAVYGDSALPWLSAVAITIALVAVVSVTWIGYRATRRVVAPMDWLLREVARWDPQRPDTEALAPANVPDAVQGEVRRMAEALHALGHRLDTHVARERNFTRDASHELRTPLTVIRVAADLIGHDEGLSHSSRRSLARIRVAAESMESLMSALLLLARDRDVPLEIEEFAVREVLEQELQKVRPLLEGKGVSLVLDVQAEPLLQAPPGMLQVMLGKLLSNAMRFTDAGSVHVRLEEGYVEIEDTGIGMDAAALARAFEPFYRASIEQQLGSGLGLSIAQRIGQRCGWPLQLTSVPGQGTRARILFDGSRSQ